MASALAGCLAILSCGVPVDAATTDYAGEPIEAIHIEGLKVLSEDTLQYYLGLEIGKPFDPEALDENLQDLWNRKLVEDVVVLAEQGQKGVVLTLRIKEWPVLRSLDYQGFKKVGRSEISDRMDTEGIKIREGLPVPRGELQRLQHLLVDMYRELGYRFADVEYRLEDAGAGEVKALFTVDEGDKVKIADIKFSGNTVFHARRLRWAMKKTKETGLITRLMKKDVYNPATFQEDMDAIRELYREKGYKNVVIGEPEIDVRVVNPNARSANQKRRMFLTIPIDEGERWKFGEISIEGNETFSDEMLLKAFSKPHGQWLKQSAIDKGKEAVDEVYKNTGHIFSEVRVELRERDDQIADVVVHVTEGDQFKVGRMEFEGNTRTRDKVLRREFRVQEGRVVNQGALRNSLLKLRQLDYFKIDEQDPVDFKPDLDTKTVDLTVKGEEGERTELLFGGGYSELDGFFGQFNFRTRNFQGRGETLGVAVQVGRVRNQFDLSYFVPWLFDKPQSAGASVFNREIDFRAVVDQRQIRKEKGGTITYGRSAGFFHSLRMTYGFVDLEDTTILYQDGVESLRSAATYQRSYLQPSWSYNKLDSRLEPTRGIRSTASLEYAGGFLGGSIDLWRPEATFTLFKPITKGRVRTTLGFNVEAGWVEPYGGQQLPLLELYYLGGENSVRGFANRSIFARTENDLPIVDSATGVRVGGNKFVELSLEYHFLLGGPFRVLLFVDGGNVYYTDQSIDLSRLRTSAGAELRIFVPVFGVPLRFIYARNLDPLPDDRFESFQFSVGTSF